MDIHFSYSTIAVAILKLFLLMSAGYVLYVRDLIDDNFTDTLSRVLVRLIFPALIFSEITGHFSYAAFPDWWIMPLSAIVLRITGMLIARAVYPAFSDGGKGREFMGATAFHNCGYLPMSLILFSFSGELRDRLLIYVFLYTLGFNLIVWSIGPLFLAGKLRKEFHPGVFLTPPVLSIFAGLLWVAFMGKGSLPSVVSEPLHQLGQAAFPVAMMVLGAYLCRYRAFVPEKKGQIFVSGAIKLLLIPTVMLLLLAYLPLSSDQKFMLFLQSTMPTAISLVVIGAYSGADNKLISSIIFYTHVVGLITIPVWLTIYSLITG